MDTMIQVYLEETEDLLQRAETCIISLEMEYSSADVNELFRIAHAIKGSSYMVGYEDIGHLMHKIEDLLDGVRNGEIAFEQSIVMLCFEGLDTVKKMLHFRQEVGSQDVLESLQNTAAKISETVEGHLCATITNKEVKPVDENKDTGFVTSLLNKKPDGKNKFFITFFIEKDAPMVSPVLLLVLNTVGEIGTLVYSSVGDDCFSECDEVNAIKSFDIILSTDVDEAELYTYFALFYVERINIVNLTRSRLEVYDYYFANEEYSSHLINVKALMLLNRMIIGLSKDLNANENDIEQLMLIKSQVHHAFDKIRNKDAMRNYIRELKSLYDQVVQVCAGEILVDANLCSGLQNQLDKLIERTLHFVKGKHIIRAFKPQKEGFINRLNNFIAMMDKSSVLILLIDLSDLDILQENEVKELINIKRQLEAQHMEIAIIVDGLKNRKIINIFDSIRPVEEFFVYKTEIDAIFGLFSSPQCYQKVIHRLGKVQSTG